jgi:hypothetical protein
MDDIDHFVRKDTMAGLESSPDEAVQLRFNGRKCCLLDHGRFRSHRLHQQGPRRHIAADPSRAAFLNPRLSMPRLLDDIIQDGIGQLYRTEF